MAVQGEVVLRQRVCLGDGCHAVFWICEHCDRGQRYCGPYCRAAARLRQRRHANRRHQRSLEGRQDHRDRQREYRRRQCRARVTDQSSASIISPAPLLCGNAAATPIAGSATPDTRDGHPDPSVPLLRCVRCGRSGYWVDPFPRIPRSQW
jgi:hypothetical protein